MTANDTTQVHNELYEKEALLMAMQKIRIKDLWTCTLLKRVYESEDDNHKILFESCKGVYNVP